MLKPGPKKGGLPSCRGLTIGELVVATGLLLLLIVSLLVLFTQMLTSTTKNNLLAVGTFFAQSVLEDSIAKGLETPIPPAFPDLEITGDRGIYVNDDKSQTTFFYTVDATQLSPVFLPGETWYVEVEVSWWKAEGADPHLTRAGMGKMYTRQGRVVYVPREP